MWNSTAPERFIGNSALDSCEGGYRASTATLAKTGQFAQDVRPSLRCSFTVRGFLGFAGALAAELE